MLILTATNVTSPKERLVVRRDGTSDYDVWVGINHACIWRGVIKKHVRDRGASVLLRLIADAMSLELEAISLRAAKAKKKGR